MIYLIGEQSERNTDADLLAKDALIASGLLRVDGAVNVPN